MKATINANGQEITYANEAEVLNVALFGKTSKEWNFENADLKVNIRDYATIQQVIVLSNMESMNAELESLNAEAHKLEKKIAEKLNELLGGYEANDKQ